MVLSAADGGPSLIRVAISGAGGRLAVAVAEAVEPPTTSGSPAPTTRTAGAVPSRAGGGCRPRRSRGRRGGRVDQPDGGDGQPARMAPEGFGAVVGTSGFTEERIADLRRLWGRETGVPGCAQLRGGGGAHGALRRVGRAALRAGRGDRAPPRRQARRPVGHVVEHRLTDRRCRRVFLDRLLRSSSPGRGAPTWAG